MTRKCSSLSSILQIFYPLSVGVTFRVTFDIHLPPTPLSLLLPNIRHPLHPNQTRVLTNSPFHSLHGYTCG